MFPYTPLFSHLGFPVSSGATVTRLRSWTTEELWFDSWKGQDFFCSGKHADRLWCPPTSHFSGHCVLFPQEQTDSGVNVTTFRLSSTEVKSEWNCTFTSQYTMTLKIGTSLFNVNEINWLNNVWAFMVEDFNTRVR